MLTHAQEEETELAVRHGPVEAHLFQYTTRVRVDLNGNLKDPKRTTSHVPIQLLVCMKEESRSLPFTRIRKRR